MSVKCLRRKFVQTYFSVPDIQCRWAVAVHAAWIKGSCVQNENSVMDSDYSLKAYWDEQMSSDGPSTKITNLPTSQTPVNVIRLLCVYTCMQLLQYGNIFLKSSFCYLAQKQCLISSFVVF